MVPFEWPIAAPSQEGGTGPARSAGSGRLSTVRLDFFLDPASRLTEQERALMTAMLADLVAMVADEFVAILADAEPANDDDSDLFDRLWAAGLLDLPELVSLLLQRSEEERIATAIRAANPNGKPRLLQSLVSDEDADLSAAAMALILARGRRRDRFDAPRVTFDDLSAESAVALVNAIAAALRSHLVKRFGPADADERLSGAARLLLSRHDEGNRVEARQFDLVHALERAGRIDPAFIRRALEEGEAAVLTEVLARRAGITFESAWDAFVGGGGRLALLLRLAGLSRDLAGEIVVSVAELFASDPEAEIRAFDELTEEEVEKARNWLRLDPAYRSAVAALGSDNGQRSL